MKQEAVARILLDYGADPNTKGGRDGTPLVAACAHGHEAMVCLLLEHGADINEKSEEKGSPLKAAVYGGHETVVRRLLDKGGDNLSIDSLPATFLQDVEDWERSTQGCQKKISKPPNVREKELTVRKRHHDAVVRLLLERDFLPKDDV
jgi:ankyrin repeat protein